MSLYDSCPSCKGYRSFDCAVCRCTRCDGTGQITAKCSSCQDGKIACPRCEGSGHVIAKKGFFGDKYGTCPNCGGIRRINCGKCGGSEQVKTTCTACKGTKRNATCGQCDATGTITCSTCKGSGQVPSEWYESLAKMPIDKLKFEYEKRQRSISTLRMTASSLTRDYEQSERECDEYQEERRAQGELHPDQIGYDYRNRLIAKMGSCESQIREMESEMSAIEKAMESNWK
jgi:hypothetical protein